MSAPTAPLGAIKTQPELDRLARLVNLARMQVDAALPSIRAGAEALGDSDQARSMWMVSYLLEGLCDKLLAAELAPELAS